MDLQAALAPRSHGWPQWEHGFRPGRPSKPVLEGQSIKDSFDKDSVDGKQAEADPCRQGALSDALFDQTKH
jgi:hypothetical protein